jgi:hypothetical protein
MSDCPQLTAIEMAELDAQANSAITPVCEACLINKTGDSPVGHTKKNAGPTSIAHTEGENFITVERVKPQKPKSSRGLHKAIDPAYQSALAMQGIAPDLLTSIDEDPTVLFADLVAQLKGQTEKLKHGDMTAAKAALYGQAQVLQALFTSLVARAYTYFGSEHYEERITLALRVQNNGRKTFEAIGRLANPSQPMVVQQNHVVMHGAPAEVRPIREINPSNELLEPVENERMDPGTTSQTINADPQLEAVAPRRRKNTGRKGHQPAE